MSEDKRVGESDTPANTGLESPQRRSTKGFSARLMRGYGELSVSDKLMVVLTAIIAFSTAWNTFYVGAQLSEMKSTGVDTHDLAIATIHLAEAAKIQASETDELKRETRDFADAMKRQANETASLVGSSAEAARSAHQSALGIGDQLKELQSEQRPYMQLANEQPDPRLENVGGAQFVRWNINYTNSGKSAAIGQVTRWFIMVGNRWSPAEAESKFSPPTDVGIAQNLHSIAQFPEAVTKQQFQRLLSEENALAIIIQFKYSDRVGNHYEDGFCLMRRAWPENQHLTESECKKSWSVR